MIKLDKRLSALLSEIEGEIIADIGCDHGKLSISALLQGKCKKVIAADISASSLEKTVKLAKEYGLSDKVETKVSDGFESIDNDLDTAIIAGLGGYEIREILSRNIPQIKRLILCPHQNASVARTALNEIGYGAVKDYIVKEGSKFYPIIVAEKGKKSYLTEELRFGLNYPQCSDYREMLLERKSVLEERFNGKEIPQGEMQAEYREIMRCLE